jgi:FHS family L-fucose permease-like MFS transporter
VGAQYILSDRILSSEAIATLSMAEREEYYIAEASAVQGPFAVLAGALLVLAVIVGLARLPRILDTQRVGSYGQALRNRRLLGGAVGIFLYVGAEVAIGTWLVNYFLSMDLAQAVRGNTFMAGIASALLDKPLSSVDAKAVVGAFVALYWGGAMVGRFIGAALTRLIDPATVLAVFGLTAIGLVGTSMATHGFTAMWSILAVGLFNSVMFPTIFTLAIQGSGDLKPQGSGILCTAIMGGAFIPPLLGRLADSFGFKAAFVLLLLCYAYIVLYGRHHRSHRA